MKNMACGHGADRERAGGTARYMTVCCNNHACSRLLRLSTCRQASGFLHVVEMAVIQSGTSMHFSVSETL